MPRRAEVGQLEAAARHRWIATSLKADALQSGHRTGITFATCAVDAGIPSEPFSNRALEAHH